jgi:hypothetical protein
MGMEYSCNILSAMVFGIDDAGVMDSVVDGLVERRIDMRLGLL